jgi:putative endonuclease
VSAAPERLRAFRYGLAAETACAWWLRLQGYRIVARRYRTPVGEIDLVARRGGVLAFIEVKARAELGELAAPTPRQRRRIVRAAQAFLQRNARLAGLDPRFDVIAVAPWRLPQHLPAAWRVDDNGR